MGSMVKLGIATFLMTALLWLGISQFLGGTESFGNRVVLRAQQDPDEAKRIREQIKRRKEKKSAPAVRSNPAPVRDVSKNEVLTVRSVVKRSDAALAQLQNQSRQTAANSVEPLPRQPVNQQRQQVANAQPGLIPLPPARVASSNDELVLRAANNAANSVTNPASSPANNPANNPASNAAANRAVGQANNSSSATAASSPTNGAIRLAPNNNAATSVRQSPNARGVTSASTTGSSISSALSQRADSDADRRKLTTPAGVTASAIDSRIDSSLDPSIKLNSSLLATQRLASERKLIALLNKDVVKKPADTRAVDLQLKLAAHCQGNRAASLPVGVMYRHESAAIKGKSLGSLDALILQYRRCRDSIFIASHNPQGAVDSDELLRQLRVDELKYYLLQRSVALSSIRFAE